MNGKQPHHVIVHNVGKEHQQEHQSDLNEALLEGQAEIAAAYALQREQENVSAVENGNGQEIQDAQVKADHCHQVDDVNGPLLHGLASQHGDAHETLQLPDGESSGEKSADYPKQLACSVCRFLRSLAH